MTSKHLGTVKEIYVADNMGEAMRSLQAVRAVAGEGLEGDRYALGRGAYSRSKNPKIRHMSLIDAAALAMANEGLAEPYSMAETRRNLLTEGVELNDLVDEEFTIGDVALRGVELCDPCRRPEKLSGKQGFMDAFQNLGGLRAEVLSSGLIAVGSSIEQAA